MATVKRSTNTAPSAEVTPEEIAAIRSSVAAKEQAPSTRVQAVFDNWRQVADQLGSPFEVERIPISKLRAMRRDPMLGFGLSFTKTPHIRAKWAIDARDQNGPNPQVAAHLDQDLRRIWPSFVLQWLNSLDFGFQAIAKRFEFRVPAGTFINVNPDTGEETEEPIWSQGGIQPIAWKPFVALPPEGCEPQWDSQGEFNGILYSSAATSSALAAMGFGASTGSSGSKGSNNENELKIDLYHSLWVTNERDANFGSIFGYPRLGYAYRYWWSYWYRWAIADRAFERKGDPSILVRHPDGSFTDENTGATTDYAEYAISMGERLRSGGVLALPSEMYEDANGRPIAPLWDIDVLKDLIDFDPFDKSFDYLDVQKLRALFIPEQAFLEGKGGTSSRNVAAELGDSFVESQALLASQIVESVNRWLIPQWIAVNYPEFAQANGTAKMVMYGFADEDVAFTQEVIGLIGNQPQGMQEILKLVDLKAVLEARGTPIASFQEQQRRQQEIAQAAAQAPPVVGAPPPGGTAAVPANTPTGFAYSGNWNGDTIFLSDSGTNFIENLPDSPHYQDKAIKGLARQLWNQYRDLYSDEYETIIAAFEENEAIDVELSDSDDVQLALIDKARAAMRSVPGSKLWKRTLDTTSVVFSRIAKRAASLELKRSKLKGGVSDSEIDNWMRDHIAEFAVKAAETTRGEVRDFIAAKMREGHIDRKEIAKLAREHFNDFPQWKADRLVRTEVRDVYNAATLLAAKSAGVELVQATDAMSGDTDKECMDRDGRVFTVDEALQEREHPNGTLGWKIVPVKLSVERLEDLDAIGRYDVDSATVQLSDSATDEQERKYLRLIVDHLIDSREEIDEDV